MSGSDRHQQFVFVDHVRVQTHWNMRCFDEPQLKMSLLDLGDDLRGVVHGDIEA